MAIHDAARKVFPAFGKELAAARRRGLVPDLPGDGRLGVLLGWSLHDEAKEWGLPHVVVPTDRPPSGYQFNFLAGLFLTVLYEVDDQVRARELVGELLAVRPASVVSQCWTGGRGWLLYRHFKSPADLSAFSMLPRGSHV